MAKLDIHYLGMGSACHLDVICFLLDWSERVQAASLHTLG